MKTQQILVNNSGEGMEKALDETEKYSAYNSLSPKNAMHVRLLSEETLCLVRAIAGEFSAQFWIEGDGKSCEIHLKAITEMNRQKRTDFLSVSSTGKNIEAKTFMGKVRDMIEKSLESYEEIDQLRQKHGIMNSLAVGNWGMESMEGSVSGMYWSLEEYRKNVEEHVETAEDAKDELEKSIVANLANNIRVGIRKEEIHLIIDKIFA